MLISHVIFSCFHSESGLDCVHLLHIGDVGRDLCRAMMGRMEDWASDTWSYFNATRASEYIV